MTITTRGRRRPGIRLLATTALAGALAGGGALLAPASPAVAATPDFWGFAYMHDPTPPPGLVLDTARQSGGWKAAFPADWATVEQIGPGRYVVHFPHTASKNGVAHVTAVDGQGRWCQVEDWAPNGSDQDVVVACYRPGGAPDDATFTVLYSTSSGPVGGPADAYAYLYTDPLGTILYDYNSAGGANVVTPLAIGFWRAELTNLGTPGVAGGIQVTAVDRGQGARCTVVDWIATPLAQVAYVACVDAGGAPYDTSWNLSYQRERAITGGLLPPKRFGYVLDTLGAVPPSPTNFNSAGQANTVVNAGPGLRLVTFPGIGARPDHVQVTAFTGSGSYCGLNTTWATFGGNAVVRDVICFDAGGTPTTTPSFVSYTSAR